MGPRIRHCLHEVQRWAWRWRGDGARVRSSAASGVSMNHHGLSIRRGVLPQCAKKAQRYAAKMYCHQDGKAVKRGLGGCRWTAPPAWFDAGGCSSTCAMAPALSRPGMAGPRHPRATGNFAASNPWMITSAVPYLGICHWLGTCWRSSRSRRWGYGPGAHCPRRDFGATLACGRPVPRVRVCSPMAQQWRQPGCRNAA